MRTTLLAPVLVLFTACGSPPQVPTADEAHKRPANNADAVRLQVCEGDLKSSRVALEDSRNQSQRARSTAARLAALQDAVAESALAVRSPSNDLYTLLFDFADVHVQLARPEVERLSSEARNSALIVLRGRTDGDLDRPAEALVARRRSEAVRDLLVTAGVDPARIRTTWQAVGDTAADNASAAGRRLNRRVEIELYRTLPRRELLAPTAEH